MNLGATARLRRTSILTCLVLCAAVFSAIPMRPAAATDAPGWGITPMPTGASEWKGVDAVAANDVWAVGSDTSSQEQRIAHWDGATWTASPPPDPGSGELLSVRMRSATDGWAVGDAGGSPLIDRWDGVSWTQSVAPAAGNNHELRAVDVVGTSGAWAAGTYETSGTDAAFLLRWNGTAWNQVDVSSLGIPTLNAVDAVVAANVWVGGMTNTGDPGFAHWDGVAWQAVAVPEVGIGSIQDIVAFANDDVWAVGWQEGPADDFARTLVMHWDGMAWTVEATPDAWSRSDRLEGIDGTSSNDLWAVGSFQLRDGHKSSLAIHRTQVGWSLSSAANRKGYRGLLHDVAAVATSDVWAVGSPSQYFGTSLPHDVSVTLIANPGTVNRTSTLEGHVDTLRNAFPGGWVVQMARRDPGEGFKHLGDAIVDEHGRYSFRDVPDVKGTVQYRATLAAPAPWTALAVIDEARIDGMQTALTIAASDRLVGYGDTARLVVHLGKHGSNRTVRVFAKPVGDNRKLVASGNVNADGYFKADVKPRWNTEYQAVYRGDEKTESAESGTVTVGVRPTINSKMVEVDRVSGRFAIYDYDRDCPAAGHEGCPSVKTWIVPTYPRAPYSLRLQVYYRGRWITTTHPSFNLSSSGSQVVHFYYSRDDQSFGLPWRVRSEFPGTRFFRSTKSAWVFYKVIR